MIWLGLKSSARTFSWVIGVAGLVLIVFWVFKIRHIQRLKIEIVQLENKLSKGQEVWRDYPPLSPEERRDLQERQERLFRMLPKDKDVPPLLQEIGRLVRDYNLSDVSFNTGDGAAPPGAARPPDPVSAAPRVVVPQSTLPVFPKVPESSGAIKSFPLRVAFTGDYREIASFLEALQKVPRLIAIQSVTLKRGVPLLAGEVVLNAYYQEGNR